MSQDAAPVINLQGVSWFDSWESPWGEPAVGLGGLGGELRGLGGGLGVFGGGYLYVHFFVFC